MPRGDEYVEGVGFRYATNRTSNYFDIVCKKWKDAAVRSISPHAKTIMDYITSSDVGGSLPEKDMEEWVALYLYTTDDYYGPMNLALRQDSAASLNEYSGLINLVRRAIRGSTEHGIVWRGVNLNVEEVSSYVPGFKFLWPAFTSASRVRSKASEFGSWGSEQKVVFRIDLDRPGLTYAKDISTISKYPDEKEVVIYCYSGFEVISRQQEEDELVIQLRTFDTFAIEAE